MDTFKQLLRYAVPALLTFVFCHALLILHRRWCHAVYVWVEQLPTHFDSDDFALETSFHVHDIAMIVMGIVLGLLLLVVFIMLATLLVMFIILAIAFATHSVRWLCPSRSHTITPLAIFAFYAYTCMSLPLRYTHLTGTQRTIFEVITMGTVVIILSLIVASIFVIRDSRKPS